MRNTVPIWRAAGESGDAAAAVTALSPEAVLISPITEQFTFRGHTQIGGLLEVAFATIDDITYTDQVAEGRTVALFYRATVSGTPIHEAQRLRLGEDGLITEITLYIRPLPALTHLMTTLGPALARRNNQPGLARVIPVAGGLLHSMAATGERHIMPKARPR
ncbi:nuclear transport factor 2 family protein [Actinoplanes sp. CA-015351]|uniref:nuclear transport factor 2 family protein n=1 Tax=Actinoplanes sp. CA-015351 TaxID=3239897 RepID=UPI003D951DCC